MIIGTFFSEAGNHFLEEFQTFNSDPETQKQLLSIDESWTPKDYRRARKALMAQTPFIDPSRGDLLKLRELLLSKREFFLRLMENPHLLEHESFTDLMWAITHLGEELSARDTIDPGNKADMEHLANDILRAYRELLLIWIGFMAHLQTEYPYLFSLAVRTNPFNSSSSAALS